MWSNYTVFQSVHHQDNMLPVDNQVQEVRCLRCSKIRTASVVLKWINDYKSLSHWRLNQSHSNEIIIPNQWRSPGSVLQFLIVWVTLSIRDSMDCPLPGHLWYIILIANSLAFLRYRICIYTWKHFTRRDKHPIYAFIRIGALSSYQSKEVIKSE